MAKKETNLEKIQRLCKHQKNIRNIATSANIHHGKCIAGSSRLVLSDGEVKTAKEIFEKIANDGSIHQENEEYLNYLFSRNIYPTIMYPRAEGITAI